MHPFLFLGHGETDTTWLRLFLVPQRDDVATVAAALTARFPTARLDAEGLVVALRLTTSPPALDASLLEVHAQAPLALVVRQAKVTASAWHEASLRDPALLDVVERVVKHAPDYLTRHFGPKRGALEVSTALLAGLEGRAPVPEVLQELFGALVAAARGEGRAVLADQLSERLPALLGFDFDCDLVLRNVIAEVQQRSPASVPMGPRFADALARRLGARDEAEPSDDDEGATPWTDLEAVRRAIAAERWSVLSELDENLEPHVQTLLALTPDELRAFATSERAAATRVANAGALRLARGNFVDALRLYDAAVEGPLDPDAAANPLFAVQNDNNHLGVDAVRARRYLERCLPAGERNPTVFLNAAFVCMELDEPERALELLRRARALGIKLKQHRNEPLFGPLRARAEFKKLVR
ncbi:MAG: hypothetical protein ACOZQL_02500 [Myxococcota bacterium]